MTDDGKVQPRFALGGPVTVSFTGPGGALTAMNVAAADEYIISKASFSAPQVFEYGVASRYEPKTLHRGPWPRKVCEAWIADGIADGVPEDLFFLVRREVHPWEPAPEKLPTGHTDECRVTRWRSSDGSGSRPECNCVWKNRIIA